MGRRVSMRIGAAALLAWLTGWTGLPSMAEEVTFLRGDVNSDGRVSVADVLYFQSYLFRDSASPPCMNAADANDSGEFDITDMAAISTLLLGYVEALPAPFPEAGTDPTEDPPESYYGLPRCESYGQTQPLVDPVAGIAVRDAACRGGSEARASIVLSISSSLPLGGYFAALRIGDGIVSDVTRTAEDRVTPNEYVKPSARLHEDLVKALFVVGAGEDALPIPAGVDVPFVELTVCLASGTPAGDYPITIETAELVDFDSGRAIEPSISTGAVLHVLSDVTATVDCQDDPPPPPPELNTVYKLLGTRVPPGGQGSVPFVLQADAPVLAYTTSIDFDEGVLEVTSVDQVWTRPDGKPYSFAIQEINNRNDTPGNQGVDEGFVIGVAVFDFAEPVSMPANQDHEALRIHFQVRPETTENTTELRFLSGAKGSGQPVPNKLTAYGLDYTPELAASFVLLSGGVDILPDVMVFIRGDSNGDQRVDISDPVRTLEFLFLGAAAPACYDAADANDDGEINISDPILCLTHLFSGGGALPGPYPAEGEDPTEDGMNCLLRD